MKPRTFHKNPCFLLKIDSNDDLVNLIIGFMVDPSHEEARNQFSFGSSLRIYPAPDENCHLQSRYIYDYIDLVPKLGFTKRERELQSIEHVERVNLTPGSYVLVPSINTNLPELDFLIRVFSDCESISLTAL